MNFLSPTSGTNRTNRAPSAMQGSTEAALLEQPQSGACGRSRHRRHPDDRSRSTAAVDSLGHQQPEDPDRQGRHTTDRRLGDADDERRDMRGLGRGPTVEGRVTQTTTPQCPGDSRRTSAEREWAMLSGIGNDIVAKFTMHGARCAVKLSTVGPILSHLSVPSPSAGLRCRSARAALYSRGGSWDPFARRFSGRPVPRLWRQGWPMPGPKPYGGSPGPRHGTRHPRAADRVA